MEELYPLTNVIVSRKDLQVTKSYVVTHETLWGLLTPFSTQSHSQNIVTFYGSKIVFLPFILCEYLNYFP